MAVRRQRRGDGRLCGGAAGRRRVWPGSRSDRRVGPANPVPAARSTLTRVLVGAHEVAGDPEAGLEAADGALGSAAHGSGNPRSAGSARSSWRARACPQRRRRGAGRAADVAERARARAAGRGDPGPIARPLGPDGGSASSNASETVRRASLACASCDDHARGERGLDRACSPCASGTECAGGLAPGPRPRRDERRLPRLSHVARADGVPRRPRSTEPCASMHGRRTGRPSMNHEP